MAITLDGSTLTFSDGSSQTTRRPINIGSVGAGSSAVVITGFSNPDVIFLNLNGITTSGTDRIGLNVGSGSFPSTITGYYSTANFSASGTAGVTGSAVGESTLSITPASAATYAWTGTIRLQRLAYAGTLGNSAYYVEWYLGSVNAVRTCVGAGQISTPVNTVTDRIRLITSGANTLSGTLSATYA